MQYGECLQMTNTLIYKFQPTNMADNKNDVIFFLGAGTLYTGDIYFTFFLTGDVKDNR